MKDRHKYYVVEHSSTGTKLSGMVLYDTSPLRAADRVYEMREPDCVRITVTIGDIIAVDIAIHYDLR